MKLCLIAAVLVAVFSPLTLGKNDDPNTLCNARPELIKQWQDKRFGLFIHWGPVSLAGTEIGWSRLRQPGDPYYSKKNPGTVAVEVYDNLYKQFNPTRFDANQWVAIAKDAGMKYLVFTTKHHDGFCNFDSKLTDYKITNSPFKRDIVKELADACHKAGLSFGVYYSQPDFYHKDFTANPARYNEYYHGQVRELLTNYGKIDIMWFDGLHGTAQQYDANALLPVIRKLQPDILINNRCGVPADFDTPEQVIGKFMIDRAWESCVTLCDQWAWKPNDNMKSLATCLETLIRCAGGDDNLLFAANKIHVSTT